MIGIILQKLTWKQIHRILFYTVILFTAFLVRVEYRQLFRNIFVMKFLNLDPTGQYYQTWRTQSDPVKIKLSFFNVTNVEQVLSGGSMIQVNEVGYFYFDQYSKRLVENFSDDYQTVFYLERNLYVLNVDETKINLDVPIVVPNLPLIVIASHLSRFDGINNYMPMPLIGGTMLDKYSFKTLNRLLKKHNESIFIRTTPRELIYGYKLKLGDVFADFINVLYSGSKVKKKFKAWFTSSTGDDVNHNDGNFSLFGLINASTTGPYEIYTGLNGTRDLLCHLRSYRGSQRYNIWKDESCNLIGGNDIAVFPFDLSGVPQVKAILTSICRTFTFDFIGTQTYKGIFFKDTGVFSIKLYFSLGIDTYKYQVSKKMFDFNVTDNQCYCTDSNQCRWNGLLNIGQCYGDIPFYISEPYLNHVNTQMSDKIHFESINSQPIVNESFILINPLLGTTVYGYGHFLMSIWITNSTKLDLLQNIDGEFFVPFVQFSKELGINNRTSIKLLPVIVFLRFVNIFTIQLFLATLFCTLCAFCQNGFLD